MVIMKEWVNFTPILFHHYQIVVLNWHVRCNMLSNIVQKVKMDDFDSLVHHLF